jgi:hypothetical protein
MRRTRGRRRLPITQLEFDSIDRIVKRAVFLFPDRNPGDVEMDLVACILGGCSLRLEDLELADDFNFTHDVLGIERHLDRHTFKLGDCFMPRFAKREVAT